MPELTRVPDADRPAGRFITAHVLPRWDELNSYSRLYRHNQNMDHGLRLRRMPVHQFKGLTAAFLYNGSIAGGRHGRLTTLVSDQALEACMTKTLTQRYAAAAGLPVAGGEAFAEDSAQQAQERITAGGDWVVKPDSARSGRGLSFHVTEADFSEAWALAAEARPRAAGLSQQIVLEKFHDGLTLRFFVVGGDVHAVSARIPLFVVGDGVSTVEQLLAASLAHRSRHALLLGSRREASTLSFNAPGAPALSEVLNDGQLRLLNEDGGVASGGLPCDVTDDVCDELRSLAGAAAEAIPGLGAGAVDIITPQLDSAKNAVVLDADAKASVRMHRYPALGRRRRPMVEVTALLRLRAEYWDKQISSPAAESSEDD